MSEGIRRESPSIDLGDLLSESHKIYFTEKIRDEVTISHCEDLFLMLIGYHSRLEREVSEISTESPEPFIRLLDSISTRLSMNGGDLSQARDEKSSRPLDMRP